MTPFLGEYEVPVDSKGRIFVPAELRRKLPSEAGETLVIVRGFDRCLNAYPLNVWEEKAAKMLHLPQTDRNARMLIRGMLSQAAEARLDRQGRAAIPRKLLARAGISDQMVVIGALDKLELWNPDDWSRFMAEADVSLEDVAQGFDL